ncbi:MAG: TrmH family RNA methyltransferase [bacterium]
MHQQNKDKSIYIVLDNVKYSNNLGPIFRLIDGLGIKKLYICKEKTTSFNNSQINILNKTSRGTFNHVDWELSPSTYETVKKLKENGVYIIGIETGDKSLEITKTQFQYPLALILGKEDDGIADNIIKMCDKLVKIPMKGVGKSLNVSTAAAIAVYEAIKQLPD